MKNIVEYQLEGGGTVLMEVAGGRSSSTTRGSLDNIAMAEKAAINFDEAIDRIKPAANTLLNKFSTLSTKPDEIGVEFGLKMNASAGAIITSGGIEANFKITLKWTAK